MRAPIIVSLAWMLLAGCSREYLFGGGDPQRARAPHPTRSGVETIPVIVFPAADLERERGLPPDALRQDARLVRADTGSLCFEVTLRGLSPAHADLRNWTIHLRTAAGTKTRDHDVQPRVQQAELRSETFEGIVPFVVQTGVETYCARKDRYESCVQWNERPVLSTQWEPGPVDVSTGGGTICFGVAEFGPDTTKVALRLNAAEAEERTIWGIPIAADAVDVTGADRLTFQWDFEVAQ